MADSDKAKPTGPGCIDFARAEYEEAGLYVRHYSNLRFAILPIYFAAVGGLATVACGVAVTQSTTLDLHRWAAGGAAVITLLFFNYHRLCDRYLDYFRDRQGALEPALGYKTMTDRPRKLSFIKTSTWVFFPACLGFWIFVTIKGV
jgi:hypothetical protein